MVRKLGDVWFTIMPPLAFTVLGIVSIYGWANPPVGGWVLIDSLGVQREFVWGILTYNVSVFYACWRIWGMPLASCTRLQIMGWVWFWGPAALPAWRCLLIPALEQTADSSAGTNPVRFGAALRQFHTFCLRSLIVYLVIAGGQLAAITFLRETPTF